MIDAPDKQTQALPLEQPKRGRGRPKTGNAMSPAEKQRAYRERQKGASSAKGNVTEKHELPEWAESYSAWVDELCRRMRIIEDERVSLRNELRELKSRAAVTVLWQAEMRMKGKRTWMAIGTPWENGQAAEEWTTEKNKTDPNGHKYRVVPAKA